MRLALTIKCSVASHTAQPYGRNRMTLIDETQHEMGPSGSLSKLPTYTERLEQTQVAVRVALGIQEGSNQVIEAGTGVGKSMAYLVPAVLSKKSVLISTHTKALQDQLANNDLPFLHQNLQPFTWAVLKGRTNYLCRLRHSEVRENASNQGIPFPPGISTWLESTTTGDLDSCASMTSEWRAKLSISSEECIRKACPFYEDCYSENAREDAREASILVVNHALLVADLWLDNNYLHGPKIVIIDEAHHLEDATSSIQEKSISVNKTQSLLNARIEKQYIFDRPSASEALETISEWLLSLQEPEQVSNPQSSQGGYLHDLWKTGPQQPPERHTGAIPQGTVIPYHAPLPGCQKPLQAIQAVCDAVEQTLSDTERTIIGRLGPQNTSYVQGMVKNAVERLEHALDDFRDILQAASDPQMAYWIEAGPKYPTLKRKPVSSAAFLCGTLWESEEPQKTVIALSATISTAGNFAYFKNATGAYNAGEMVVGSPFPYQENTLLYVPQIPPPSGSNDSAERTIALHQQVESLSNLCQGGIFVLCTSWRRTEAMHAALGSKLKQSRPVYLQGEMPIGETVRRFKEDGNAVLFGTRTFWEGIDIPGDALQIVILDRIPFPVPSDPTYMAKAHALKAEGKNDFIYLSLPAATITLKQGFGRLIRSHTDRGVVMIGDPRLTTKGYGKNVLRSLPPARVVEQLSDVEEFFRNS